MANSRVRQVLLSLSLLIAIPSLILLWPEATPADGPSPSSVQEEQLTLDDWPKSPDAQRGRRVYEDWCIGCHGDEGRGDGEAARFLNPQPRNFQHAAFKFRTTPNGKLPTVNDLVKTITCGLAGSSMPGFPLVPEVERRNVAKYILHLATWRYGLIEVEDAGLSLDALRGGGLADIQDTVYQERVDAIASLSAPPSPKVTPELIAKGKARYLGECSKCHGDTGIGDGSSSFTLRDWKDGQIIARDFTTGVFRSGSSPADLFLRLKTGLNGTPMPSIPGSDEELWAMVHFILSLKDPNAAQARVTIGCATGGHDR